MSETKNTDINKLQAQVKQLQVEVERLQMQKDILKKPGEIIKKIRAPFWKYSQIKKKLS